MRKWFKGLRICHKPIFVSFIFMMPDAYLIDPIVAGVAIVGAVALVVVIARGINRPLRLQAAQLMAANEALQSEITRRQQAEKEIQKAHDSLEARVKMRTCELQLRFEERIEAEAKLEETHKQLVEASRHAGMAEVATGVLHNVGNVLNSVNVSMRVVEEQIRKSEIASLAKLNDMIAAHKDDLAAFFAGDERGKHVPGFLAELTVCLRKEQKTMLDELATLSQGVDHIREIVSAQQSVARKGTVLAPTEPARLLETALAIQGGSLQRHGIEVVRRFEKVGRTSLDTHKVLQILINLINNAKQAMDASGNSTKRLTLVIDAVEAGGRRMLRFHVIDCGVGIPPENLTKIFVHGFTTKKDGHGFGLHSAANAAREMGGDLSVSSQGPGQGAAFVLEIPFNVETVRELRPTDEALSAAA